MKIRKTLSTLMMIFMEILEYTGNLPYDFPCYEACEF